MPLKMTIPVTRQIPLCVRCFCGTYDSMLNIRGSWEWDGKTILQVEACTCGQMESRFGPTRPNPEPEDYPNLISTVSEDTFTYKVMMDAVFQVQCICGRTLHAGRGDMINGEFTLFVWCCECKGQG